MLSHLYYSYPYITHHEEVFETASTVVVHYRDVAGRVTCVTTRYCDYCPSHNSGWCLSRFDDHEIVAQTITIALGETITAKPSPGRGSESGQATHHVNASTH